MKPPRHLVLAPHAEFNMENGFVFLAFVDLADMLQQASPVLRQNILRPMGHDFRKFGIVRIAEHCFERVAPGHFADIALRIITDLPFPGIAC